MVLGVVFDGFGGFAGFLLLFDIFATFRCVLFEMVFVEELREVSFLGEYAGVGEIFWCVEDCLMAWFSLRLRFFARMGKFCCFGMMR